MEGSRSNDLGSGGTGVDNRALAERLVGVVEDKLRRLLGLKTPGGKGEADYEDFRADVYELALSKLDGYDHTKGELSTWVMNFIAPEVVYRWEQRLEGDVLAAAMQDTALLVVGLNRRGGSDEDQPEPGLAGFRPDDDGHLVGAERADAGLHPGSSVGTFVSPESAVVSRVTAVTLVVERGLLSGAEVEALRYAEVVRMDETGGGRASAEAGHSPRSIGFSLWGDPRAHDAAKRYRSLSDRLRVGLLGLEEEMTHERWAECTRRAVSDGYLQHEMVGSVELAVFLSDQNTWPAWRRKKLPDWDRSHPDTGFDPALQAGLSALRAWVDHLASGVPAHTSLAAGVIALRRAVGAGSIIDLDRFSRLGPALRAGIDYLGGLGTSDREIRRFLARLKHVSDWAEMRAHSFKVPQRAAGIWIGSDAKHVNRWRQLIKKRDDLSELLAYCVANQQTEFHPEESGVYPLILLGMHGHEVPVDEIDAVAGGKESI